MTEGYILDVSRVPWAETPPALSPLRLERAARCRVGAARERSLGAGAALDYCLSRHGLRERETPMRLGPWGKPEPAGGGFHFNLSHSGPWALCVWSEGPVGADVERLREPSDALLRRVCAPGEAQGVRSARDFLWLWTAKESYAKLLGRGLSLDFREIELARLDVEFRRYDLGEYGATLCAAGGAFAPALETVPLDWLREEGYLRAEDPTKSYEER